MSNDMNKMIREQMDVLMKLDSDVSDDDDGIGAKVEEIELNSNDQQLDRNTMSIHRQAYAAGYLRGVAEATGVTIRELVENIE